MLKSRMVFLCVNEPHILFPFFYSWTSWLFPDSGYHNQGCYEHSGTRYPIQQWGFFWVYSQDGYCRVFRYIYFHFMWNLHNDFQKGCTTLQSHRNWMSFPLSAHPWQPLLSAEALRLAIPIGVRLNLRDILICLSLITKDFEHLFILKILFPSNLLCVRINADHYWNFNYN